MFPPFSKSRKNKAALRKVEGSPKDMAMDKKMGTKEGSPADMRQDMKMLKKRSSGKAMPKR